MPSNTHKRPEALPPTRPPTLSPASRRKRDETKVPRINEKTLSIRSKSLQNEFGSMLVKDGTKEIELNKAIRTYKRNRSLSGLKSKSRASVFNINVDPQKIGSLVQTVDQNSGDSMENLEVAAFCHLVEWCENAERVKKVMKKEDMELIQKMACCSRRCINCFCPGYICCGNNMKNRPTQPAQPTAFSTNSCYVRHAEATYTCCCCFRCPLNLFTALFIWWDIPLLIFKARLVLLFQVVSQLATTVFQWVFLIELANSQVSGRNNYVQIPVSTLYATIFVFFLPDIIHCVYITQAPGYNLRGISRQIPQVIYSLLSQFFVRPIYELCWSFKWTQIMPYVTLQNEGSVITDSGMSERFIIWTGLASTLREFPLRVIQFYVLAEYWNFWTSPLNKNIKELSAEVLNGGSLAGCTILNEWSVMGGIVVGLGVSAFALSDQLEREVPNGAFPRRFSRALANTPSGFLWTFIFLLGFFVDLFLRFAIIVPLSVVMGLSYGMFIALCWLLVPVLVTCFIMNEKLEDIDDDNIDEVKDSSASDDDDPNIREKGVNNSTNQTALKRKKTRSLNVRRGSEVQISGSALSEMGRSSTDIYDDGMLLGSLNSSDCCGCCCKRSFCDKVIETTPFILWGVWVDLPMRLKWLRLRKGNNDSNQIVLAGKIFPKSCVYYWMTSVISILVVLIFWFFTMNSVDMSWNQSTLRCEKLIPLECQNTGMLSGFNVTSCPANLTTKYLHVTRKPSLEFNSTWVYGCLNEDGQICQPDMRMISRISANHVNVELMRFLKSLYLSELKNRGKWCCTNKTALERKSSLKGWKNIRNMIGPSPDLSSQPSFSGTGSPRRIDRIIAHHNQFKNWKSSLRARDIQLLLRLSRNMPNNKHLSNFTEADKDVVDIAKCVLGTGGVIDIHLNQSLKKVLENEGDELRKELLEGTDNVVKVASRIEYLVSIEKQKMNQRASDLYQTDLLRKKAVGERKKHEKMEENSSEEKISTIYRTSKSFDEPSTILSQPEADLTVGSKFESCFGEGTIKCLNEDGSLVFETVWGGMVYAKHISALT